MFWGDSFMTMRILNMSHFCWTLQMVIVSSTPAKKLMLSRRDLVGCGIMRGFRSCDKCSLPLQKYLNNLAVLRLGINKKL